VVGLAGRSGASLRLAAIAIALSLIAWPAAGADIKTVLVLYSSTRLLPAAIEADRGLRENLASSVDQPVELYAEFLDLPRFDSPDFIQTFARYLHEKYAERPPDVIVTAGSDALVLLVRNRTELFPDVPVVYIATTKALLAPIEPLPPDVIGVPVVYDSAGTVALALRWHPDANRLVVVAGGSPQDREVVDRLHGELAPFADRVQIEYFPALGMPELEKRLAALGPGDVVFATSFFMDGDGRAWIGKEAAAKIAAASPAPVYAPFNTYIGTGVVGGRMPSFAGMGKQGAELVNQLLAGATPQSLAASLPERAPTHVEVDWRQARRFGIRESDVPADAVIQFKEPTFWEEYRGVAIGGIAVMAVQAVLIGALLVERRQRQRTAAALDESERRMGMAARAAALSTWSWEPARPASGARLHPADRAEVEKATRRALESGEDVSLEYRVIRPDGEVRWLAAYGRREAAGGARLLGVSRDVTERKQAELAAEQDRAALRHMTRVSTLGQLSASIAHQLNQPLAAILSNAEAARQLLGREPLDLAELREICDDIVRSDSRAVDVIRRLTALFRRGEVPREPVDVNELLLETLELTRTELAMRHVALLTHLAPDLPRVDAERVQLQQVFLNLVMNAADAMEDTKETERELTVRSEANGGDVRISVSDTGSGISARNVESVFDPFWTTKAGGMGMGLAICRSIVQSHHGTLMAANNPDRGATFCVALPAPAP